MGADEAAGAGSYLLDKAFKAPGQVTPGTRLLEGEYVHDIGHGLIRVEPWKAHYDENGRLIVRTDYNAANNAHGIPEVHHHLYEWRAGCTACHVDHIPGEFPG